MPPYSKGQLVVFGGGGFLMEPDNPLMEDYLLGLCRRDRPRVCFVPTAAGDSIGFIERFFEAFPDDVCEPGYLSLFSRKVTDLRAVLSDQDLVYVGGGNTVNLLAVWRAQGMDAVLEDVLAAGTIFCGVSAGALCWFQSGITDSYGPDLQPLTNGLGLLEGSFCPHYDSDPRRPGQYGAFVARTGVPGIAAEDGVALHYVDGRISRVVTSRPGRCAYRVTPQGGEAALERMEADYLGGS